MMALSGSSPFPILLLLTLLSLNAGRVKMASGEEGKRSSWCVAKASASEAELEENIKFACEHVGEACKVIEENGGCFNPTTLLSHASVVMNLYYKANGLNHWNCYFSNSALISITDPSYGDCNYA